MASPEHVADSLLGASGPESAVRMVSSPDVRKDARLERLIQDHYEFVWRSARRLGVRSADLDDVVQEVFVVAANRLDDITHEKGFLFRACVFAASHARRTVERRREVVDDELVEHESQARSPEESASLVEARAQFQAILEAMPERAREVFVLFELEEFTISEIAQTLDVPIGTVSSRLRKAREIFLEKTGSR